MKRFCIVLVFSVFAMNLHATTNAGSGQKWYGPYTLTKVARYYDNVGNRMSVHVAETPETTCSVTNQQKKMSYFNNPAADSFADSMFSAAAAAQAQNKKVMLLLDVNCNATYGLNIHGVEILSE